MAGTLFVVDLTYIADLARAKSREDLNAVLDQDPFKAGGVAEYRVTAFNPVMTAESISF